MKTVLQLRRLLALAAVAPLLAVACSGEDGSWPQDNPSDATSSGEAIGSRGQAACDPFRTTTAGNYRWKFDPQDPNKIRIPYRFDGIVTSNGGLFDETIAVVYAMTEWSERTGGFIEFVGATDADVASGNYVKFSYSAGGNVCMTSEFGNYPSCSGNPTPTIFDIEGCALIAPQTPNGRTLHEIGHLIGLDHVQLRSDRDRYLKLAPDTCFDCGEGRDGGSDTVTLFSPSDPRASIGVWDYNSLMLYPGSSQQNESMRPDGCGLPEATACTFNGSGISYPKTGPDRSYIRTVGYGGSPCPDDVNPNHDTTRITASDASWVVELFRTAHRWQPFKPLGYDRSSTLPREPGLVYLADGSPNHWTIALGSPGAAWAGDSLAFVRGNDNRVYARWRTASRFDRLPGTGLASDPAAVSWSKSASRIDVVAFKGGQVSKIGYYNGNWESDWSSLGAPSGGLGSSSGPAITSTGLSKLEVFALDSTGGIAWKRWSVDHWSGWNSLPTPPVAVLAGTKPAVASHDGVLHIVVRGTDQALYYSNLAPSLSAWRPWIKVGGPDTSGAGSPALSAASYGTGVRLDLYVRDPTRGWLYQQSATSTSSSWVNWPGSFFPLGGTLVSDPAAVAAPGLSLNLQIFAVQNDGALWQKQWPCTDGCDTSRTCP